MTAPRKHPDTVVYSIDVEYEVSSGQPEDRGARILIRPRLAQWAGFDTYRDEMGQPWSTSQVQKFSDLGTALRAEYESQKRAREEEITRVKKFVESREEAYRTIIAAVPDAADFKADGKLYPVTQALMHGIVRTKDDEVKNAARWERVSAAFERMIAGLEGKVATENLREAYVRGRADEWQKSREGVAPNLDDPNLTFDLNAAEGGALTHWPMEKMPA